MIRICTLLLILGATTLHAASATAGIIFDNFDIGGGFHATGNTVAAFDTIGPNGRSTTRAAARFTVSGASANLDSITLPISFESNVAGNTLRVRLAADAAGAPGATLETLSLNQNIWPNLSNPFATTTTLTSAINPLLSTGSNYWIVTELTALSAVNLFDFVDYRWFANTSGTTVQFRQQQVLNGGLPTDPWAGIDSPLHVAFRVEGTAVPEPTAASLLAVGLFVLGMARQTYLRRRLGAGQRVNDTSQ